MKKSLKVLFFGNERIATGIDTSPKVLSALIESSHEIVGLVVHASESQSRSARTEPIIEFAKEANIPILNPTKPADAIDQIKESGADIGVLVAYGRIIPQEIIDVFPHGIINLHPSALPKLRGSTPIESVILSGQTDTAVSIMKLVAKMDAGPVLTQKTVSIPERVSKQELADILHEEGARLLLQVLEEIADGRVAESPQDDSAATFCTTINKADGRIDWTKSAVQIEREIRAYAGWPTSYFEHENQRYVVKSAEITDEKLSDTIGSFSVADGRLVIQTANGVVWPTTLQPAGKKEMPISAFLNGYRIKLGI